MTVTLWSPIKKIVDVAEFEGMVAELTFAGTPPCNPLVLTLLGAISTRILEDPQLRRVPQYVALGYWLRPAALRRLAEELLMSDRAGQMRTPRGLALHLPPTNVDTIFVYSWAMSVLAGNANIVRLPEAMSAEADWLATVIATVVAEYGEGRRHFFCHYSYGGQLEATIAQQSDLRMIWGGDDKVKSVSRVPIRPDGLSIGFPDRKSLAMIDTAAYRDSETDARDALARSFFNDLFWFDQMGCGSPRLLVWIGEPGTLSQDFYQRLEKIIAHKRYAVETGIVMGKRGLAYDFLAEGVTSILQTFGNALYVSRASHPHLVLNRTHGGGFLCDWVANSTTDIAQHVSRVVQTITHFGINSQDLNRLAQSLIGRGGYRLVPIGEALQFDTLWDGVDLYEHMTRRVLLRQSVAVAIDS